MALAAAAVLWGPATLPGSAAARAAGAPLTATEASALAYQAYEYGIPLMEFLRQARQPDSCPRPASSGH